MAHPERFADHAGADPADARAGRRGNFNGEERHFHVGALYFGVDEGRWRLLEAALADP
jgi:hypothetical protein